MCYKKQMILLIVIMSIMLSGCAKEALQPSAVDEIPPSAEEWQENSKEVEVFKKSKLTSTPDRSIGDLMSRDEFNINYWKFKEDGDTKYLLCDFNYNNVENSLVFYQDQYKNINVAEYYISEEKQDKETTDKFVANLTKATDQQASSSTSNSVDTTQKAQKQNAKYPYPYTGGLDPNDVDGDGNPANEKADGFWTPQAGTFSNGQCSIVVWDYPDGFNFKIYDGAGNLIFKEHQAIFEAHVPYAIYRGQKYTLVFSCSYDTIVLEEGFDEACKNGNTFRYVGASNNSGVSSDYMPVVGTHFNSGPDDTEECAIEVTSVDYNSNSFKFKIYKAYNWSLIFKEHTAVFETNSSHAIYRGQDYTLTFDCSEKGYITLGGFNEACASGNIFCNTDYFHVR